MSQSIGKSAAPDLTRQDLEAVLDTLAEGVVALDTQGRVVGINHTACDILGVQRQEVLRMDCRGLFGAGFCTRAAEPAAAGPAVDDSPAPGPPAEHEREVLRKTLQATGWNVAKAARRLNISRTTLYERIARFGLTRPND
jgi:transcriptional regulator with PAS, ATPase and Fis domain